MTQESLVTIDTHNDKCIYICIYIYICFRVGVTVKVDSSVEA
jgi:hypothetical protein